MQRNDKGIRNAACGTIYAKTQETTDSMWAVLGLVRGERSDVGFCSYFAKTKEQKQVGSMQDEADPHLTSTRSAWPADCGRNYDGYEPRVCVLAFRKMCSNVWVRPSGRQKKSVISFGGQIVVDF